MTGNASCPTWYTSNHRHAYMYLDIKVHTRTSILAARQKIRLRHMISSQFGPSSTPFKFLDVISFVIFKLFFWCKGDVPHHFHTDGQQAAIRLWKNESDLRLTQHCNDPHKHAKLELCSQNHTCMQPAASMQLFLVFSISKACVIFVCVYMAWYIVSKTASEVQLM